VAACALKLEAEVSDISVSSKTQSFGTQEPLDDSTRNVNISHMP